MDGDMVTYACNTNYVITGSDGVKTTDTTLTITCSINGLMTTWTNYDMKTCEGKRSGYCAFIQGCFEKHFEGPYPT